GKEEESGGVWGHQQRRREECVAVGAIVRHKDRRFRGDEAAIGHIRSTGRVEKRHLGVIELQYESNAPVAEVRTSVAKEQGIARGTSASAPASAVNRGDYRRRAAVGAVELQRNVLNVALWVCPCLRRIVEKADLAGIGDVHSSSLKVHNVVLRGVPSGCDGPIAIGQVVDKPIGQDSGICAAAGLSEGAKGDGIARRLR